MKKDIDIFVVTKQIRDKLVMSSFFPYDTGLLRRNTTAQNIGVTQHEGKLFNTARINFNASTTPYVVYLEEGTRPHDIYNAFGFINPGMPIGNGKRISIPDFGIGGRFDGFFHPGSTKHKNFISHKSVAFVINEINKRYKIDKIE